MKKLLTILCLVLLSSYSYSKEVIPGGETGSRKGPPKVDAVTKKGPVGEMNRFDSSKGPQRVYKPVRESGYYKKRPYEKFYENGQLEQRGNLINKEPDGLWEWFHKNGQLELRRTYNNGEIDGLWEGYYENGQLQLRGNFKNGKLDGPYETFYDNGQLEQRGNYKNGKMDGLREYFDKDGNLTGAKEYKDEVLQE
mgnify:FL=1